ncbi:MAG TPA: zinc ribbon domain-containing protein [Anaerolineales bacterium]|nr:zinc ribbon domain-containing protein [Anaerolineales bacterium]
MDFGSILLGLALLLLAGFIVARPLIDGERPHEAEATPADSLLAERDNLLTALRDLDFDHATGKIADEDYTPQRAQLVARGVSVLKELEALGAEGRIAAEDEIEQAVAARRRAGKDAADGTERGVETEKAARQGLKPITTSDLKCPSCGALALPEDKFCAKCGTRL